MTTTDDAASYERLANDVYVYGSVSLALAMARETKVLECLCTAERSLTSEDIAGQLKLKERYVRELLNSLAVAGLVQLEAGTGGADGKEARYWVPPTCRQALRKAGVNCIMVSSSAKQYAGVRKCFDLDGPSFVDCSENWDDCYEELDEWGLAHLDCLTEKILETPGLKQRLEKGLNAVDVGCGTGLMFVHFAAMFPNSHFTLTELDPQQVEEARKRAEEKGLTNVSFRQLDVLHMPDELEEKFDWLLTSNVIHDLPRPLDGLKGICKALKPGGHYSLVDVFVSSYVAENVESCKPAAAMYSMSLFSCLPESHRHGDSETAGASCHHSDSEAPEKGLNALDVGCGTGFMFVHFAAMFPNSHFTLTDLEPQPLETARKRAEEKGLKNVSFRQLDVYNIPDEFEVKFDWLLTCDVVQHLPRPLDALKGVCKALKPGGHYSLVDVFVSNYVAENVESCKPAAALYSMNLFYGFSEDHHHGDSETAGASCHHSDSETAGASCHHSDSEAPGACWGSKTATELVEKAGMKVLKLARSEALNTMAVCMCQKPE